MAESGAQEEAESAAGGWLADALPAAVFEEQERESSHGDYQTAFMASDGEEQGEAAEEAEAAEEGNTDEEEESEEGSEESGEKFDTEMVKDDEDNKKMEDKFQQKTDVNARGRIHLFCDRMEDTADMVLVEALGNPGKRDALLAARSKLLRALWTFRDTADAEDDFLEEEFRSQMKALSGIRRKLGDLDSRLGQPEVGDGPEDSSDGDETEQLQQLRRARQVLRYAMTEGAVPAA